MSAFKYKISNQNFIYYFVMCNQLRSLIVMSICKIL